MAKKSTHRSQDRPQTKIRIANRRERLVKLFAEGKSTREAAKVLQAEGHKFASKAIVARDLQALATLAPANLQTARAEAHTELTALKKFVMGADDMKDSETVHSLLAIHDRIVTLLGLAAPTKSISAKVSADVDPSALVGYRKFVAVTCHMDAAMLEKVYTFASKLNVAPAVRVIGPPATSELWDEPKQLAEGK